LISFVLFAKRKRLDQAEVARAASSLRTQFEPLFGALGAPEIRRRGNVCLIYLHLPVKGWRPSLVQEDDETWVLAPNYPMGASAAGREDRFSRLQPLPRLARQLQDDPHAVLEELAPPFSLIWQDKTTGALHLQNDGLGLAPLFEYEDGECWAIANRPLALRAVGVELSPVPEQWAVRMALGWFPLDLTGFKGIAYLAPGTGIRLNETGMARTRTDVLTNWLHAEPQAEAAWLERARSGMLGLVGAAASGLEDAQVGLTGGRDSRAVASCLLALGIPFQGYVHGLDAHPDVRVARKLAQAAGIALREDSKAGVPPGNIIAGRRSIELALRWQLGSRNAHKHKTFLAGGGLLGGGRLEISGQHGEIGRAHYARKLDKYHPENSDNYDGRLVGFFTSKMPPFLRSELIPHVIEVLHSACRQADHYGVEGAARWDFFYLFERTRRWSATSHASKPGIVFAPFMNPDYIRAASAVGHDVKRGSPFHTYIVSRNWPDWTTVSYGDQIDTADTENVQGSEAEQSWQTIDGSRSYDTTHYWQVVGMELIHEALSSDGFWTEVFDPTLARSAWIHAPDELVMLHLLSNVILA